MSEEITERRYNAAAAQEKWAKWWQDNRTFATLDDGSKPRRYMLDMFAYPSGDLHMGHAEAWAIGDVIGRYWKLKGYDVMHPVGWDSFGLPAENAAIKRNAHPAEWTYANIETQAASFRRYAVGFDWDRRLHTSDPEYYRWTQWLFIQLFNKGLAYRKDSYVNWCPKDQTVLANEQVVQGACERCGAEVTKRQLNQWYFKITDYAQQLLDDMKQIEDGWPERVLAMQRNWIGRSEGAYVNFVVEGQTEPITVFTTRPDTLFGATFMVVAPDSELAQKLVSDAKRKDLEAYLEEVKKKTEIERQSTDHEKTGVNLGVSGINPLTGEHIPIWAADYVLSDYGTGAIMAVPAHDARDFEFATKFNLPIKPVIMPAGEDVALPTTGDGVYVNSGPLNGLTNKAEGVAKANQLLVEKGAGQPAVTYRLRDWLISRQRFWGCPIPIIHCPDCGDVAVPEDQLPVTLPDLRGEQLAPKGTSPLAAATEWMQVSCPQCGGKALRDTDTMDTFVDSSWYFFRYCSTNYDQGPFDPEAVKRWMPVAQYVGGIEHAILHLLYARFFTKVIRDLGLIDFDEPFTKLMNQGSVILGGKAMSKSLGNMVDLGDQIETYGVDAVRTAMIFAGPPEDDIDWADMSLTSTTKFLQRAYRVALDVASEPGIDFNAGAKELRAVTHRMILEISELVETGRLNVVVARIMELVNATRKFIDSHDGANPAVREAAQFIAQAVSLVAPYLAEEMWEAMGLEPSVASSQWPQVDSELLKVDEIKVVVQIQGKVKAVLQMPADISEEDAVQTVMNDATVQQVLAGRPVVKTIVRLPKLISLVPGK